MSSERGRSTRAEASRRNGARSRGPRTEDGKARAAQNALKHGLRAQRFVLLGDEDGAEFQAVEEALREELAPEGALQSLLLTRIALAAWRMFRADRMEVELLDRHVTLDPRERASSPGVALIRDGHGPRAFDTLLRYRGAVQAEFWRALRALYALQAGDPVPAALAAGPARLAKPRPGQPAEPAAAADRQAPHPPEPAGPPRDRSAGADPNEPESRRNPGESTRWRAPERPGGGMPPALATAASSPARAAEPPPGREPSGEATAPRTSTWLPRILGFAR